LREKAEKRFLFGLSLAMKPGDKKEQDGAHKKTTNRGGLPKVNKTPHIKRNVVRKKVVAGDGKNRKKGKTKSIDKQPTKR